jgi:hypothetical protein
MTDIMYVHDGQAMMAKMAKKDRPAPRPVVNTERLLMRVSKDFLQAVDEWRRKEADLPGRTEAVRRLVQLGIDASAPRKR